MCIRDRVVASGVFAGEFGEDQAPVFLVQFCNVQQRGHMPCLLYTSDAADERSSVDLGGRRIIKKKNSQSIRTGCYI